MPSTHLPPVGIVLIYNLKQVPSTEAQACLLAGDQAVSGWVIVKVAFHKYLGRGFAEKLRAEAGENWRGRSPVPLLSPTPRVGTESITQSPSFHKERAWHCPSKGMMPAGLPNPPPWYQPPFASRTKGLRSTGDLLRPGVCMTLMQDPSVPPTPSPSPEEKALTKSQTTNRQGGQSSETSTIHQPGGSGMGHTGPPNAEHPRIHMAHRGLQAM